MSAFLTGVDPAAGHGALWPDLARRWLSVQSVALSADKDLPMHETIFPATEDLFRAAPYAATATAQVLSVEATAEGAQILLDRTIFYPMGGGQPGDSGTIRTPNGAEYRVQDTRKGPHPGTIAHVTGPVPGLVPGTIVSLQLDWPRRHRLMRMHTALHLLSAVVPAGVTGGQVGEVRGRLDFDSGDLVLAREAIEAQLNALIAADHPVGSRWITEAELDANPALVKTMSVQPPRGTGRVRLIDIPGVDLQPCGGTHVARTGEIGPLRVEKIESKGKRNRRILLAFADADA